jgi:hypothetical protein
VQVLGSAQVLPVVVPVVSPVVPVAVFAPVVFPVFRVVPVEKRFHPAVVHSHVRFP